MSTCNGHKSKIVELEPDFLLCGESEWLERLQLEIFAEKVATTIENDVEGNFKD